MKEITATMAGTVLSVRVGEGDLIDVGQEVLVIESMKMEIPLESQSNGKVIAIKVAVGDFVNEGDVLLELE